MDCWRNDGRWFHHTEKGERKQIDPDYVTHWMPAPPAPR
ncbi:hypothetical protein [Pseudorhodoplanes sinuspersici]